MKKYILILLPLWAMSCAPKVQERQFPEPKLNFASDTKDVNLKLRIREFGEAPPELGWRGEIATAVYFDQAEGLIELGDQNNLPDLHAKGVSWIRKFYQSDAANMTEVASGPFMHLAAAQTEKLVQSTLNDVLLQMEDARTVIREHVLALPIPLPQNPHGGLDEVLKQAQAFNISVLEEIPRMKLPPVIASGFAAELVNTTTPLFAQVRKLMEQLNEVKTLTQALNVIDEAIAAFDVTVTPELAQSLKQGRLLAQGLDQMKDPQGALTVVIDVWNILTPEERADKIRAASKELFDFLSKQNAKEMNCLRTRGCLGGPVDGVIKKVFILPKLKDYGVQKMHDELNAQTLDFVFTEIRKFSLNFVGNMPQNFADNIETAWLAKTGRMVDVRADYQSYVTRVAGVWAKRILPQTDGKIPGFESSRIQLTAGLREKFNIKAVKAPMNLQGEVAGGSLSANMYLMQNSGAKDELGLRSALSQVNKIVALSGYRNTRDALVPALLAPVSHRDPLLDIMNFEEVQDARLSFRLPDLMPLQDAFMADPKLSYAKDFSASAFASQIRGLSQMLKVTADWKKSSFDQYLTPIQAQDLTRDAVDPSLQQSLFPKDMIFALNVGTVSVLLQDMVKTETPVFLLTLEDSVIWANNYTDKTKETPVMAGIVDIKDGHRAEVVNTVDVAKLILGLGEFLEALDGVENTKSSVLLTKNEQGTLPLDAILNGKKDIRRLVVALGNFLSNKMKVENDLVAEQFSVTKRQIVTKALAKTDTQAWVIRALVKAHEVTGIDAYKWAATDAYYGLNRRLFNVNKEFYINADGAELAFPEKVNTLRAMTAVRPYVSDTSRVQLQKIMKPWMESLAAID